MLFTNTVIEYIIVMYKVSTQYIYNLLDSVKQLSIIIEMIIIVNTMRVNNKLIPQRKRYKWKGGEMI